VNSSSIRATVAPARLTPVLAKVVRVLGRVAAQLPRLIGDLEELRAAALDATKEVAPRAS
jgi:hypothetical protein